MREHKFRAWDKEEKKILSWEELKELSELVDIFDDKGLILMQYTGLKDKNNKNIYDGYIIKYSKIDLVESPPREWLASVFYDEIKVRFMMKYVNEKFSDALYIYGMSNIEIIGNIYENPELLKGE